VSDDLGLSIRPSALDRIDEHPSTNGNGRRVLSGAAMSGVALAVPDRRVPNAPIAERLGVDDRWIVKRTGIVERPIAEEETVAQLSALAAARTLEATGCQPADVDLVLVATMTPDLITPNVAPMVVKHLDLGVTAAADVGAACTGWLHGVNLAASAVEGGRARNVLVIGADFMSRVTDQDDRSTAALWADGVGSVLVSACKGASRIGPVVLGTDPEGATLIHATHDEGVIRMRGQETFGAAVHHLSTAAMKALDASGVAFDDIDLWCFHQANARIIRTVGERLELPQDKVICCVDRYGNSSAATLPIALAEADAEGRLQRGAKVLLSTFGAGFTWGATVVEWGLPAETS
jgi:3-oxoacyl-[acyl-carrier-protein] synthase-3